MMKDNHLKSSDHWTTNSWEIILSSACTIVSLLIMSYTISMHTIHYNRPQVQRYIIRILLVCPVYAVSSWLSITLQQYALQTETIRDIYEAFVIYSFLSLVLEYSGGEANCVGEITTEEPIPYMWPLRRWLKPRPRDGRLIRFSKRGCLQFVFIKPIMAAFSIVMVATDQYWSPWYQWMLLVIYNVSYTVALYCLALFYTATKKLLRPYRPVVKFAAVKSVVFATYWQSLAVAAMPGLSQEEGQRWNNLVLCVEMVPFALVLSLAFGYKDYAPNTRFPDARVLDNIKDVISVKDIVDDTYHNFMPTYREYVLQSAGQCGLQKRRRSATEEQELESPRCATSDQVEKGEDSEPSVTSDGKDSAVADCEDADKEGAHGETGVSDEQKEAGERKLEEDGQKAEGTANDAAAVSQSNGSGSPWRPQKRRVVRLRTFLAGNLENPKRLVANQDSGTDKLSLLKTLRGGRNSKLREDGNSLSNRLDLETLPGVVHQSEDPTPVEKSYKNDANETTSHNS